MSKWLTAWTLVFVCTSTSLTQAEVFERFRTTRMQEELTPQTPATPPVTEPTTPSPSDSVVVESETRGGRVAPPVDGSGAPFWGDHSGVGQKEMYPFVEGCNRAGDPCCNGWWDNYCAERHCGVGLFKLRHHWGHRQGKGCDPCGKAPISHPPVFQKGGFFPHQKGASLPHQKMILDHSQKGIWGHHQKGLSDCPTCDKGGLLGGPSLGYRQHRPHLGLFDWKHRHAPDLYPAAIPAVQGLNGYSNAYPGHVSGMAQPSPAAPELHFDVPAFEAPSRFNADGFRPGNPSLELQPVETQLPETSHSA